MIEDPELRALFKAECEEHLQTLEDGLLRLEAEPGDSAMLEELFRSAHSLKGAARMLDVGGVETLAHHFEDQLGAARHGHLVLTPEITDRLYRGLDAIRRLAREASDGEAAQVDIPLALAQLRGESAPTPDVSDSAENNSGPDRSAAEAKDPSSDPPDQDAGAAGTQDLDTSQFDTRSFDTNAEDFPLPKTTLADTEAGDHSEVLAAQNNAAAAEMQAASTSFKIETIRVEPQKLDALMTLAGEMSVTTTRMARALTVIEDLISLSEEWGHEAGSVRADIEPVPNGRRSDARNSPRKSVSRSQAGETGYLERLGQLLGQLERTSGEEITRLSLVAGALDEAIRNMRLLPFSAVFNLFPRLVRDLSREQGKEVRFVIEGGTTTADKHLLEEIKDPLMHMLRNAVDHGIEPCEERLRLGKTQEATLLLRASQASGRIVLEISDDGRGLNAEAIRRAALKKGLRSTAELDALSLEEVYMLIFEPGFSTSPLITNVSGRGVGLDVVRTNIERLKGTIKADSVPGRGCTFRLETPLTLATTRVLLVRVAERSYALPVDAVRETALIAPQNIFTLEGRPTVLLGGQPVATALLADLLELPSNRDAGSTHRANGKLHASKGDVSCIFLFSGTQKLGVFVDALLDEQEVVLKPFGGLLRRVRNVLGSTILSTGEICMVLNPQDMMKSAQKERAGMPASPPVEENERKKVILLAEDSITTRTQEKRILESAGYAVVTAVDGADAFRKLGTESFDAVVSDVEMPNMDGLTLAARIREDVKYKELPIILVTSLASDADRQRGVDVGASAYLTKGTFEQKALLDALRRLI